MNEDSPFERWRLAAIPQVAASPELMALLAQAFEGGRQSRQPAIEKLHEMYEAVKDQRDELMGQQRAWAKAIREMKQ